MILTKTNGNKVGKMAYTSSSMLRLENFREELLRIKKEHYFGLSDVDFAREIGLSAEGYRKIVSLDKSPKYTRSSTIYAIALRLNMNYEIKEEGGKQYVYFTRKKVEKNLQGESVTFDNSTFQKFANLSPEKQKLLLDIGRYMDKDVHDLLSALIRKLKEQNQNQEKNRD